jgi:hypothetical protein
MSMWSDACRFRSRSNATAQLKPQVDFYDTLYRLLAIVTGALHSRAFTSVTDNQNLTCIRDLEQDPLSSAHIIWVAVIEMARVVKVDWST